MTKWILWGLGVVLVVLVGWWLWPSSPDTTPNQGQTGSNGVQYPSRYTVSTTQGGSQAAPVVQPTDLHAAFAALFSKVGATGVDMSQVDSSSSGDAAAVYALYQKDIVISKELYPKDGTYAFHTAFVDLNEDGMSEAIVYEDLPGFCGLLGCPLDIYQKQAGTWTKILSTIVQGQVGLLNVYINGYRSLLLTTSTGGSKSNSVTYAWDGKTYKDGTKVATWDGTSFEIIQ